MYVAQVNFKVINKQLFDQFEEQFEDPIYSLLAAWYQRGQILRGETVLARRKTSISVFVNLPDSDALNNNHNNVYVQNAYERLQKAGLRKPQVQLLSDKPTEGDACRCANRRAFILTTTYLWAESPLRCSNCFRPIPLYQLPPTYDNSDYYDVLQWQADYQACDRLQMGCATGERFGLREMEKLDSSLSKRGIEIGNRITALTKKPVYYYLFRYRGKSREKETQRKCPSCAGEWLLKKRWHTIFDFRCDKCTLLSNLAMSL